MPTAALIPLLLTFAQDPIATPKLLFVRNETFRQPIAQRFLHDGKITWKPGSVVLSQGASLGRREQRGGWFVWEVAIAAKAPGKLRLTCVMDAATNWMVELDSAESPGRVRIIDTVPEQQNSREQIVNEAERIIAAGAWIISYRYGLIHVRPPKGEPVVGYLENEMATVSGWKVTTPQSDWTLDSVKLAGSPPLAKLTPEQQLLLDGRKTQLAEARGLRNRGQTARAMDIYNSVYQQLSEFLEPWRPELLDVLSQKSRLYKITSRFDEAEIIRRDNAAVFRSSHGEQHPYYAFALLDLADLYVNQARMDQARIRTAEVLKILEASTGEKHEQYIRAVGTLGNILESFGDYAQALPLQQKAAALSRELFGPQRWEHGVYLNNLAGVYEALREFDKAIPLREESLKIIHRFTGDKHPAYAVAQLNLADVHDRQGNLDRAIELVEASVSVLKAAFGTTHPAYSSAVRKLAAYYADTDNAARRTELLLHSLEVAEATFGKHHVTYLSALNSLGLSICQRGDYDAGTQKLLDVVKLSRDLVEEFSWTQSARQQLSWNLTFRRYLDHYLSMVIDGELPPQQAYEFVLNWKGSAFHRQRQYRQLQSKPDLQPVFTNLKNVVGDLSKLRRSTGNNATEITRLVQQKEELEAQVAQLSAEFKTARNPIKYQNFKQFIPKATALVDFLEIERLGRLAGRHIVAFVQTETDLSLLDLGSAEPIENAITNWRKSFGTTTRGAAAAAELRKLLWEPIEPKLAGRQTILLSLDGMVAACSFAAIPGRNPGSFLLEDYRIGYLPTPRTLMELLDEKQTGDPRLLLVGGVEYGAAANSRNLFQSLPETVREVESIQNRFQNTFPDRSPNLLQGGAASEKRLRAEAPKHTHLHLATHGFFASKRTDAEGKPIIGSPDLDSGLVLEGANLNRSEPENDGLFHSGEIALLPLQEVELVVLSACETGLGIMQNPQTGQTADVGILAGGEGWIGVQRAFQLAGAKTTIASIWKVDDEGTRRLMERFYHNLWNRKMSRIDSLREAQIWMLRDPTATNGIKRGSVVDLSDTKVVPKKDSPGHGSPQLWAAFTISGDWR